MLTYSNPPYSPCQSLGSGLLSDNHEGCPKRSGHGINDSNAQAKRRRRGHDSNDHIGNSSDYDEAEGGESQGQTTWACPFVKLDPIQHLECMHLKLQRTTDVKQHIKRRHVLSEHYCPRCYKGFALRDDLDLHESHQTCKEESYSISKHGISADQRNRLAQRVPRTMTHNEQWNDIWAILFGEEPRPLDGRLGNVLEEVIGMIREFWYRKGSPAASRFLEAAQCQFGDRTQVSTLLDSLVEEMENHFGLRSAESNPAQGVGGDIRVWEQSSPDTEADVSNTNSQSAEGDSSFQSLALFDSFIIDQNDYLEHIYQEDPLAPFSCASPQQYR